MITNLEELISLPKLPPTNDIVFKSLFTREDTKIPLMSLINAFTGIEVKSVEVENAVLAVENIFEKEEIFDVSATTNDNEKIDIELQASHMEGDSFAENNHKNVKCRSIYNVSDLYSSQDGVGVPYGKLKPAYQIMICNYNVFSGKDSIVKPFNYRNEDGILLDNSTTIIFVELKKYAKLLSEKSVNDMTKAELWALYLIYADNPEYKTLIMEIIRDREEFQMATNALNTISTDENLRALLRSQKKSKMLNEHNMAVAKLEQAFETAKNLLGFGVDKEIISKSTGLSIEEISKLSPA
jgi:predicted transposase/invertase (TIGR01784 family)